LSQILQSQVHAMLEHVYSFSMNFNKRFETWLNTVFSMILSMFQLPSGLLAPALVNLAHPCAMASLSADDYEPPRI